MAQKPRRLLPQFEDRIETNKIFHHCHFQLVKRQPFGYTSVFHCRNLPLARVCYTNDKKVAIFFIALYLN